MVAITLIRKDIAVQEKREVTPLAHSPDDAAKRIGISTRAVYCHIATGELRSYKDGKRRLIPDVELQRYVERKLSEAGAA